MARQKATIRREVITNMKNLGVYNTSYSISINTFVQMLYQYEMFTDEFEKGGYTLEEEHTNKAGATNSKKSTVYGAMEKLRMDISKYANDLRLTPKSLGEMMDTAPKESPLDKIIRGIE